MGSMAPCLRCLSFPWRGGVRPTATWSRGRVLAFLCFSLDGPGPSIPCERCPPFYGNKMKNASTGSRKNKEKTNTGPSRPCGFTLCPPGKNEKTSAGPSRLTLFYQGRNEKASTGPSRPCGCLARPRKTNEKADTRPARPCGCTLFSPHQKRKRKHRPIDTT